MRQQYQKNSNKRVIRQDQEWTRRRYSERNIHAPESVQSIQISINNKDTQIRRLLAKDLKDQIQQNQIKKKGQHQRKIQEEKRAIYASKQMSQKQLQNHKITKQKIIQQMAKDYNEKMKRKQQRLIDQLREKQAIANRFKQIQALSTPQRKIKSIAINPEVQFLNEVSKSPKIPQFYKQVANFQIQNSHKYQKYVKNSSQFQNKRLQDIIQSRIRQNQRKQHQYDRYQKIQRQNKRQQLQRVLKKQIQESEKRKQQQLAYQKSRFYGPQFQNVYNPIVNPVDSRFCKDNKYLIGQLYTQGEKQKSRQSQSNTDEIESSLARKGSRSLL